MNDFDTFKAAVMVLANCASDAGTTEQFAQALIGQRNNPFHSIDFLAYATNLQNAVTNGIEAATAIFDDTEGFTP